MTQCLKLIPARTGCVLAFLIAGCSSDNSSVTAPVSCVGRSDTTKVPLNDLGTGCYLQYQGGLYPNGVNAPSGAHLTAGLAAATQIVPLDVNGQPSANGRYVMISIGMSNTTQEFCADSTQSRRCQPPSFMAQAAADAAVNHATLVLVDGAYGGRAASSWVSASSAEYDRIRDTWLTPQGLSEQQVQIAWVKVANPGPTSRLPAATADAYVLESSIGQIARALRTRYPNLRQIFLSSRIYAGCQRRSRIAQERRRILRTSPVGDGPRTSAPRSGGGRGGGWGGWPLGVPD